jgi:hypothetical protein
MPAIRVRRKHYERGTLVMFELTNEELHAVSGGHLRSRGFGSHLQAFANGGNGGSGGAGGAGGNARGGLIIIEIGFAGSVFYNISNTVGGNGGNGGNGGGAGNGGTATAVDTSA